MTPGGYIKLHRRLLENPLWLRESFTAGQAWTDLLMTAEWERRTVFVREVAIHLRPGELCCSLRALAKRWKWDVKTVIKFLAEREAEQMLEQRKTHIATVITIRNWGRYQGNGTLRGTDNGTLKRITASGRTSYGPEEGKKRRRSSNGKDEAQELAELIDKGLIR